MSTTGSGSRWLAPAALAVVAVIALLILLSGGGSGSGTATAPATTTARAGQKADGPRFYVVKQGDTLSAIAMKTGVSVETIQQLNPGIDVQALQPGQRLRLRA